MRVDCSITENFLKERNRMLEINGHNCGIDCEVCPLHQIGMCAETIEPLDIPIVIGVIQKWSDEHQQITNLDYLLKHFPNTILDEDGTPAEICPDSIGLPIADGLICKGNHTDCKRCWSVKYEEK